MKTAYLYIRVSTDEQADTGYSQRSQEETLKRYCDFIGITVKEVFFEDHSAKNFNRPQWSRLLLLLHKYRGIVDCVLFTKWDRFSRNAGDAYAMIATLNKLGVDQQAIEQPLDLSVPENKLMLAFYLAAPEVENDRRALNILGGMRRAKKEGRWMGTAPLGYKNKTVDGRKTISICSEQAPIMKWVFEELAKGILTVRSIMMMAIERGLKSRFGKPAGKASFWASLRNPVYYGKIKIPSFKSEEETVATGMHEPLITEELFYQVQDVLDGKKKRMRTKLKVDERFPLRGFLICPQCAKLLTASSSKGRHKHYHYYHCYSGCNVRYDSSVVNDSFRRELSRWKPHPAVGQLYKLVLQDMYEQGDKLRQTELKRTREDLIKLGDHKIKIRKLRISDELDAEDYRAEKKECEEGISRLEAKLSGLLQQDHFGPQLEKAYDLLSNIDLAYEINPIEWKRELIGSMFPEKLQFTGTCFRTARVNEVAEIMFNMGAAFSEIKMGQQKDFSLLSQYVDPLVHFSNRFLHDLRTLTVLKSKAA